MEKIMDSLTNVGSEIVKSLPNFLLALAVLIIGWIITKIVVGIVKKALRFAKADKLDDKINEIEFFGDKKLKFNIIKIISNFVKWIMYIIILIIITDILDLIMISEEIKNFLGYLPRLFSALVIFTIGLLLANFVKKTVKYFFESMDLSGSKLVSQIVFLLLIVFISITALNQAGVNTQIITSNITIILGAFLFAFALAFGLGAQKIVGDLLRTFYARKTYEIGQKIEFNNIIGEVEAIDNISVKLITKEGKLVIPIKDIVESQVKMQD